MLSSLTSLHLEALMIVNVISVSFLYYLQETDIYAGLKYNRERIKGAERTSKVVCQRIQYKEGGGGGRYP